MVLLCAKKTAIMGDITYKVKTKFPLDQMQVMEGDTIDVSHTFFIRDDVREIQLYTT